MNAQLSLQQIIDLPYSQAVEALCAIDTRVLNDGFRHRIRAAVRALTGESPYRLVCEKVLFGVADWTAYIACPACQVDGLVEGGECEDCDGDGQRRIELQSNVEVTRVWADLVGAGPLVAVLVEDEWVSEG